jgi:hypothetical protein
MGKISMDLITALPCTTNGYTAILVVVDYLTKMTHLIPTTTEVTAAGLALLFRKEVYHLHGLPKAIISDRDPRFTSDFWKALCSSLNINLNMSTAYHPETDGQTERVNQTIEVMLRFYVNYHTDNWDQFLDLVEYSYNNQVNASTTMSPFYANFGYLPTALWTTPSDSFQTINQQIHDTLTHAQANYTATANKKRKNLEFKEGDLVYLSTKNLPLPGTRKLSPCYLGPYEILQKYGSAYKLKIPATWKIHDVFHVSLLKEDPPASELRKPEPPPPDPVLIDGNEEFEVETILDDHLYYHARQYLVKWKGYPDPTWEPGAYVEDTIALEEYQKMRA